MLGKGSVSAATGDFHLRLRKLLKPAFSMSGVSNMIPRIAAMADRCLGQWADAGQVKGMRATKEFTFRVSLPYPPLYPVLLCPVYYLSHAS